MYFDILHALEALSRFPFIHADPRFRDMLVVVASQADADGRYTAASMYQSWKGWSFADKKNPSPLADAAGDALAEKGARPGLRP